MPFLVWCLAPPRRPSTGAAAHARNMSVMPVADAETEPDGAGVEVAPPRARIVANRKSGADSSSAHRDHNRHDGRADTRNATAVTTATATAIAVAAAAIGDGPAGSGNAADDKEAMGAALLRDLGRRLTVHDQRVFCSIHYLSLCFELVSGILLLLTFDTEHAHFGYAGVFGGAGFVTYAIVSALFPVSPEVFGRLAVMPGAPSGAAKLAATETAQLLFTVVHNVAVIALTADFMFSDLAGRGGAGITTAQRWAVVLALAVFVGPGTVMSLASLTSARCRRGVAYTTAGETALAVLLAGVTRFADDVEAGLPLRQLERRLLALREIMVSLRVSAAASVVLVLTLAAEIVGSVVVCIIEWPHPPAVFVYASVALIPAFFFTPLTPARVDAELRRVPVAISVRACGGGGDGGGGASAESDTSSDVDDVDDLETGSLDDVARVEAEQVGEEVTTLTAAAGTSAFETEVRHALQEQRGLLRHQRSSLRHQRNALRRQRAAQRKQQLDLLLTRIDRMRLGWYVMGVPVTSTLLVRVRALAVALTIFLLRDTLAAWQL